MKRFIQNFDELATSAHRRDALEIVEAGYRAIDTASALKNQIHYDGTHITIQEKSFTLANYEHIYIVGFGKIACVAAATLEAILKNVVHDGAVIGITEHVCDVVTTYQGTHPLPSETNFKASQHIREVSEKVTERDLVLVIVGGGGSALLCASEEECNQGQQLYRAFLDSGGTIQELNTVRKHISEFKGGGLAKLLYPAEVVGLVFSDVPGDDYAQVASGPTYKDETTIADAKALITKYNLGDFALLETPKEEKYFEKVTNIVLVSNHTALESMMHRAHERQYEAIELACDMYGFPEKIIARLQEAVPEKGKTAVIAGGEARLVIPEHCRGSGGRNNYVALEMLSLLKDNQVFISFASDGKDNGIAAGALADKETQKKADKLGLKVKDYTECLNSFPFFEQTGDLLMTGPIEANVSDLMVLLTFTND